MSALYHSFKLMAMLLLRFASLMECFGDGHAGGGGGPNGWPSAWAIPQRKFCENSITHTKLKLRTTLREFDKGGVS
jgi:hypothetical protein